MIDIKFLNHWKNKITGDKSGGKIFSFSPFHIHFYWGSKFISYSFSISIFNFGIELTKWVEINADLPR